MNKLHKCIHFLTILSVMLFALHVCIELFGLDFIYSKEGFNNDKKGDLAKVFKAVLNGMKKIKQTSKSLPSW